MSYMVSGDVGEININPETLIEEVVQNVAMILATRKGTVPLDRDLGLSQTFVDEPMNLAKVMIISEIMEEVGEYEPRATIKGVTFKRGRTVDALVPVVEVDVDA